MMIVVGVAMLYPRRSGDNVDVRLDWSTMRKLLPILIATGLAVGLLSGFFGIGGGFLIVPGLIGSTAMPLIEAIGSSLVAVTAFGTTTAASYAVSGYVDWQIAGYFILGGAIGGVVGMLAARRLGGSKRALTYVFSTVVIACGLYISASSLLR
jgi:uncharacterized membrane protein YfcA